MLLDIDPIGRLFAPECQRAAALITIGIVFTADAAEGTV
jgi:hypothetical protein